MTITTNVPAPTFGPNGFTVPTESAILVGVQADINAAFGGNLNQSLSTPQGQLASSLTAIIGEVNDNFLFLSNQFDPALASGRWLDGLANIYLLTRNPALSTVVSAVCTGLPGVTIPVGALALAADGNLYSCTGSGVIPGAGSITLSFSCNNTGPIACQAGSLNTIYQAIAGWDTINNPSDGVIGRDVESDFQFEARRVASVASNSVGALSSMQGAVLSVPGVLSSYVTENPNSSPVTINGFTLASNSVYVAVAGGAAVDIAQAIWSKKAPGCAYNGNTSYTVLDTSAGYSPPFPSYLVTWETPSSLPILFSVNLVSNTGIPSNATTLIQNAIINAFAGGDGGPAATIGALLLASRYYPDVTSLGTWAQIRTLQIGSQNTASASVIGTISGNTLSVARLVSGALAVGQTLVGGSVGGTASSGSGAGIIAGTTITALGSGVGGTGTYTISIMQNLGATFTGTSGTGTTLTAASVVGSISVGDTLSNGTGIPSSTTITGQISGTLGGNGIYTTSLQTSISGITVTANVPLFGVLANQNSVQVQINQVPTITANDIAVTVT